jgi:hypothetical protein
MRAACGGVSGGYLGKITSRDIAKLAGVSVLDSLYRNEQEEWRSDENA